MVVDIPVEVECLEYIRCISEVNLSWDNSYVLENG